MLLGTLDHVGGDEEEIDHADVHAEVLDLAAERVAQALDAGLRGAVRAQARRRPDRRGGGVQEHVALRGDQVRKACVDGPVGADEVHVDLNGEYLGLGVAERALCRDARVGEAEVDAAEALDRGVDGCVQAVRVRDVGAECDGVRAAAVGGRLSGGLVEVDQRQLPALASKPLGRRRADAAAGARDERCPGRA